MSCERCAGPYEYKIGPFDKATSRVAWHCLCRSCAQTMALSERGVVLSILSPDWAPGGAGPLFPVG